MNRLARTLPIILSVLTAGPAVAGYITYTNRSAFESALATMQKIDFESGHGNSNWNGFNSATGYTASGANFVGNFGSSYYLYIAESDTNSYGVTRGVPDGDFLLGEGRGSIDMTLPTGQHAVGMDFAVTEIATGTPANVTFSLTGGPSYAFNVPAQQTQFFGIISDDATAIDGINFRTTAVTRPPQIALDNFTFGTISLAAVPEPGTFGVLGVLGLGLLLKRRRRESAIHI